jgi:lactate dehydrogenase-like 2-hydroxyacid dehydrogenase
MKPHVLLAAKVPPFLVQQLAEHYILHDFSAESDPARFALAAPHVQALVANGESIVPEAYLARLPALKMVAVFGVGYDGVDVRAAKERGIQVTNTPDVLTDDVADWAIALMLAVCRGLVCADRFVKSGRWGKEPFPLSNRVSGARIGIVGLGRIGRAIAERAEGFNMAIAYTARSSRPDVSYAYYSTPEALAAAVDILVVSTVGGPSTRGLIDANVLQALGPQGILINVARGTVVDEPALIDALVTRKIAGAGLDVFANEPDVPAAFLAMDNVILTPHAASGTHQTRRAMADLVLSNLEAFFSNRPLLTPVAAS